MSFFWSLGCGPCVLASGTEEHNAPLYLCTYIKKNRNRTRNESIRRGSPHVAVHLLSQCRCFAQYIAVFFTYLFVFATNTYTQSRLSRLPPQTIRSLPLLHKPHPPCQPPYTMSCSNRLGRSAKTFITSSPNIPVHVCGMKWSRDQSWSLSLRAWVHTTIGVHRYPAYSLHTPPSHHPTAQTPHCTHPTSTKQHPTLKS